jgi:hypothetical protein
MHANKSSRPSESEQGSRIGREGEEKSTIQQLHKASSDVTAAMLALELIKESNTPRAELVSRASNLLSEALKELKKALYSHKR